MHLRHPAAGRDLHAQGDAPDAEKPPRAVATDWICSYRRDAPGDERTLRAAASAAGGEPIDTDAEPNATGRDFGNWFPARLTLEKVVEPARRPRSLRPARQWQRRSSRRRADGDEDHGERAAGDLRRLRSSPVDTGRTRPTTARRGVPARCPPAAGMQTLRRRVRRHASLYGRRSRRRARSATSGPGSPGHRDRQGRAGSGATAGDTLRYTLDVTNSGDVPVPRGGGRGAPTRPATNPPVARLKGRRLRRTPTLDPGETWTYALLAGDDRGRQTLRAEQGREHAARYRHGDGTHRRGTRTRSRRSSSARDQPNAADPRAAGDPGRDRSRARPGPVVPPGPPPPNAGAAAVAGVHVHEATQGCITTESPRVTFRGTRIRRVRVFVNGRDDRRLTCSTLQRSRSAPRVAASAPGPSRQLTSPARGSGTPPVTLRGASGSAAGSARASRASAAASAVPATAALLSRSPRHPPRRRSRCGPLSARHAAGQRAALERAHRDPLGASVRAGGDLARSYSGEPPRGPPAALTEDGFPEVYLVLTQPPRRHGAALAAGPHPRAPERPEGVGAQQRPRPARRRPDRAADRHRRLARHAPAQRRTHLARADRARRAGHADAARGGSGSASGCGIATAAPIYGPWAFGTSAYSAALATGRAAA